MGSAGGGKTTTTGNSAPWQPQQQYLTDIFGQARNLYNQDQGNGTPISPIYQQYLNQAMAASTGALPQEGQVNATWNQGMNAAQLLQPRADAIAQAGYDYTTHDLIRQQMAAGRQPNTAIGALQQAAGSQWARPFEGAAMMNAYQQNPYTQSVADAGAMAMQNPAARGLATTASGAYLTPNSNPYLQASVQDALDQANATIASQFNKGGRYGSGMMAGTQARELGKIATSAYANAYEQERARQEQANQVLGQQYLASTGQFQQGLQGAGGLSAQQQQQGLAGILGAGELAQQQQALSQQATTQAGNLTGEDLNRQFQAQQAATNAYLQDVQNRMASQQAAGNLQLQGLNAANNALQFAPEMQGMQSQQLADLLSAASTQQGLLNLPQEQQWDALANYLAMVQGSYGGTSTQTQKPPANPSSQPSSAEQSASVA